MAIELLAREAEGLSEEELQKVFEYIQFLKYSMHDANDQNKEKKEIKRIPGGLKGPLIMADDFDEILDDFKEYM